MYKDEVNTYHKVILVGESQAGKTSIICRQINGYGPREQNATIGCCQHEMEVTTDNTITYMHVWDTAGQEIYRSLVPMYSKGAEAVIIVFDITCMKSFEAVNEWYTHIKNIIDDVPMVLAANKVDMRDSVRIGDDMIADFASSRNMKWFRTSAVTGEGIKDLFQHVAKAIQTEGKVAVREPVYMKAKPEESGCC